MLMLDDMPSTTYYRNRKKAIRLYATMLWAFTRPEKIQNKMEEINWKKSGSKVAVKLTVNWHVNGITMKIRAC